MTAIPRNDADAIVARLDHTAFLAAASLDDRIDLVALVGRPPEEQGGALERVADRRDRAAAT